MTRCDRGAQDCDYAAGRESCPAKPAQSNFVCAGFLVARRPDRLGDLHAQADSAPETKLLAALPIPGLRVGLRRGPIRLRFEQRHERQRGDEHAPVDPNTAYYCTDNCHGNGNGWDCGFNPDREPYPYHDAIAEEWLILCESGPSRVTMGIHIQVTCVMKIDCHFWASRMLQFASAGYFRTFALSPQARSDMPD